MPQVQGGQLGKLDQDRLDGFAAGVDNDNLGGLYRLAAKTFQQLSQVVRPVFGCDNQ
jgi:hypothetical protein